MRRFRVDPVEFLEALPFPVEQRFAAEGIERQVGEALRPVAVLPAIEFRLNQPPHRPEPGGQPEKKIPCYGIVGAIMEARIPGERYLCFVPA